MLHSLVRMKSNEKAVRTPPMNISELSHAPELHLTKNHIKNTTCLRHMPKYEHMEPIASQSTNGDSIRIGLNEKGKHDVKTDLVSK